MGKKLIIIFCLLLVSCSHQKVFLAPLGKGENVEKHVAKSKKYMITSPGRYASLAGEEMFQQGGNIIDAFAALSFVLSVERPQSTGIGGGGFLLFRNGKTKKIEAFDFREKAPLKAHKKMYLDNTGKEIKGKSVTGIFSAAVPGLVAGVLRVHKEKGTLPLAKILAPAIALANEGFEVYPELAFALKVKEKALKKFPATRKIFFKDGNVLKEGDQLVQKDLGRTLSLIAKKGELGFYDGEVAHKIIHENRKRGGLITKKDFKKYNMIRRKPIAGDYKGYRVFSMPPPSSGGIHIIQILNILENDNLEQMGVQSSNAIHLMASSMQQAFADRAKHLGDSDFVHVPVEELVDKKYARKIREKMPLDKMRSKEKVYAGKFSKKESDHTTHFTIVDEMGNVVTSTQTINGFFGSSLVVPGTGILLNNEMDDFATKAGASNIFGAIGGNKNLVEPEKRPLSSMSPTIVTKDGNLVLALGTPNGTRILTCVAQTILNYLEFKLPLYESVMASRFHQQWSPDQLYVEEGFSNEVLGELEKKGHKIHKGGIYCKVQAIAKKDNDLIGVSDARGRGFAIGR